jgi:hypothetical protein
MRTLNELYKLLLTEFETNDHSGICCAIIDLKWFSKITMEEYHALLKHFKSERPKLFKNTLFIFKNKYRYKKEYWWPIDAKAPRIEFIKHLINKTNEP